MAVEIKKLLSDLPVKALKELLDASQAEGFHMVERLIADWDDNANRFNKPGEAFFIAEAAGRVIGIGGRNIDPYVKDGSAVRVRRIYVLPAFRRQSVGRLLLKNIMDVPPGMFAYLTLHTGTAAGAKFYESLGFSPTGEEQTTHQMLLSIQGAEKYA